MSLPHEPGKTGNGAAAGWPRRSDGAGPACRSTRRKRIWPRSGSGSRQLYPAFYRADRGYQLTASPLRREFTRNFEPTLVILVSTAGFVLLIVCASVANLAVARTMRRDRELALRTALGASRGRLLRQLITESLLLALAGGAGGLLLAFVGLDLLVEYAARFTPRATEVRIDTTVLLFTLAVSLLTGIAAAILPAVSRRLGPRRAAISAGPRTAARRSDLRRALIVAQVAASFMLLIGAGLDGAEPAQADRRQPGVQHRPRADDADRHELHEVPRARRARRVPRSPARPAPADSRRGDGRRRRLGSVSGAGGRRLDSLLIDGRDAEDAQTPGREPSLMIASDDYFRAMDIAAARGTVLRAVGQLRLARRRAREPIVCRAALARGEPDRPAHLRQRRQDWLTVVGVVADVRQQLALEPVDEVYAPMRQIPYVTTNWAIRSPIDPAALAPLVREAVRATDPDQPIHRLARSTTCARHRSRRRA